MKDYEKAAIGIGIAALGLAAYQAHKSKQAVDATLVTDPSRNPIQTAVELSENMVAGVSSWFQERFDDATGYTKGKAEEVVDKIKAVANSPFYVIDKVKDFGVEATESGSKYVWSFLSKIHDVGKKKAAEIITNKPYTKMGAMVTGLYDKRIMPKAAKYVGDVITGIGSKKEEVYKKTTGALSKVKDFFTGYKAPKWITRSF